MHQDSQFYGNRATDYSAALNSRKINFNIYIAACTAGLKNKVQELY